MHKPIIVPNAATVINKSKEDEILSTTTLASCPFTERELNPLTNNDKINATTTHFQ
jgi:hypothetical protein